MSLNESIVEEAALEWIADMGYAVGHGPHLGSYERAAERCSFCDVDLGGLFHEAIRGLNRTSSSRTFTTLRDPVLPKRLFVRITTRISEITLSL